MYPARCFLPKMIIASCKCLFFRYWQHGVRHQINARRINAVFSTCFLQLCSPQVLFTVDPYQKYFKIIVDLLTGFILSVISGWSWYASRTSDQTLSTTPATESRRQSEHSTSKSGARHASRMRFEYNIDIFRQQSCQTPLLPVLRRSLPHPPPPLEHQVRTSLARFLFHLILRKLHFMFSTSIFKPKHYFNRSLLRI